jgi:3-oxoacyl-[acyl-carrier-protein] synthase III
LTPVRILGTSSLLPGPAVPTRDLAHALGGRDAADLERKTGITSRHWITPGTRASELGAAVLRDALDRAGLAATELRRVIFVSTSGGDMLCPATANDVCLALGLDGTCDCFDVNNACMGFLSAFDIAARSVATGLSPVGVVVVETLSPFLSPENPRPYLVVGDAAAAAVFGPARPGEGVLSFRAGNRGKLNGSVTIGHPGLTGARELIQFGASHEELTAFATAALKDSADAVLRDAGCTLDDVAWVLTHQPNGRMLERIIEHLGVPSHKVVPVVREIGSVAAASIPVSLDRLLRTRDVKPGDRVLIAGVGAGMSYGALLYQVAP